MSYKLIAPLHDYQKRSAKHVLQGKGNALFLEMGLGKTLTALEIINHRMTKKKIQRTLILAPRRICEQVWREEATRWGYPLSVNFLKGSPARRLAELQKPSADIYLMTYENLIWLEKTKLFPFDLVVLDELSKMKNAGSKRWGAFRRILTKHKPETLGLTGTPAPNGYTDLWAQMYCLDQGDTLGKVEGQFLNTYFTDESYEPHKYHKWVPVPGSLAAIDQLLKKAGVLAMRAKDVLGQKDATLLPTLRVALPKACQATYQELEDELMATMPDGTIVLPEQAVTVQMKLRQLSSGFMIDEEKVVHRLHQEKVVTLLDYIQEMDGEPLMVVYTYTEELAMILEHMPGCPYLGGGVPEKAATSITRRWNAGEIPVLLVQPQAAGHGLNLQLGPGHHILCYSVDWNLETYEQVIARLNRQGQKSPVFVRHMAAGVVEDSIATLLDAKARTQKSLMKNLR